jgi:predicted acetyltransferase
MGGLPVTSCKAHYHGRKVPQYGQSCSLSSTKQTPRLQCRRTMTAEPISRSLHVELLRASSEQQPLMANLLQLYCHDFNEYIDIEIGPDGKYPYDSLPLYWTEPHRHPFLITVNGAPAGFALVKRAGTSTDFNTIWDMAEFFVVRRYRRRGIGTKIAKEVFKRYLGHWEIRVLTSNHSGVHFWDRAITEFVGQAVPSVRITKNGHHWQMFSFASSPVKK